MSKVFRYRLGLVAAALLAAGAANAQETPQGTPQDAAAGRLGAGLARAARMAAAPRPALAQVPPRLVPSAPSSDPLKAVAAPATLQAWVAQSPVRVTGAPQTTPPPDSGLPAATHAAGTTPADPATVAGILDLAPPDQGEPLATRGLSSGQAVLPFLPSDDDFAHQAAQAIVQAFQAPKGGVAADAAAPAADAATPADPAFDERVGLVMTLYQVDGTEAVIRHYVATEHMKLIIKEVRNHIDISRLSDADKYRLASIAAIAQTELEDRIITLNARVQAANLTQADLMQLIAAYDTDAQRKLTQLRLNDDGRQDQIAGIDVVISEYTILRDFIEQQ